MPDELVERDDDAVEPRIAATGVLAKLASASSAEKLRDAMAVVRGVPPGKVLVGGHSSYPGQTADKLVTGSR